MNEHLQPFFAAERLKTAYRSYITTSFPLRREQLRRQFNRLIEEERLLWQDAFVSLARTPKPGRSFAELADARAIAPDLADRVAFGFKRLHDHQSRAIQRLSTRLQPSSTIVATSTGSGKTEAFLVPIFDHCLREQAPGIKAVVIYPMNALANDQLKRLRTLLRNEPGVTFARYTGETPEDEQSQASSGQSPRPEESPPNERYYRQEIRSSPPDILLTNYTMLELLLTRGEERKKLFTGAPLRYLVIDEVHTFQGVLGTEVACLVRRLKEHAGVAPGDLKCVGTSATLQSDGGTGELVKFATRLFGEPFAADSVVVERLEPLPPPSPVPAPPAPIDPALLDAELEDPAELRGLGEAVLGESLASVADGELSAHLYERTRDHPLFLEVERALERPRPLESLRELFASFPGREDRSAAELDTEAAAVLLLGAAVESRSPAGDDLEPRFKPKVHLLMRSLSPLGRCLDSLCGDLLADGRLECRGSAHDGALRLALPLGVCRTCGQDYWIGSAEEAQPRTPNEKAARRTMRLSGVTLSTDADSLPGGRVYLMPSPPPRGDDEDEDDEDEDAPLDHGARVPRVDLWICSECRTLRDRADSPCPGAGRSGDALAQPVAAFVGGTRCPHCLSVGTGREIITPLRSGASSSISVLTTELFDELNDDERRTLIFADSRQDTAHQAGFLRDRHQQFVRRQLIQQSLAGAGTIPLTDLGNHTFQFARERFGEVEAMNLLIPADRRDMVEKGFYKDPPAGGDITATVRRLAWHAALEFTVTARQRNSIEREGLAGVRYSRLDELARGAAPNFAVLRLEERSTLMLLRAVLDLARYQKAINLPAFRELLDATSPSVMNGDAVVLRHLRIPTAFSVRAVTDRSYKLFGWYNRAGRRTAVDDLVARMLPGLDATQRHELIDLAVKVLRQGFLDEVTIGRGGKYPQMAPGLQLAAERIEVSRLETAVRCDRCQRARGGSILTSEGNELCLTYQCGGAPKPFHPDPKASYYVDLYQERSPKPMHAMEHSGQLSGEMRQGIERQFNDRGINVLVCTPTLELGVDLPDLVALLMRNIPPTPANYAQRAGRAGRRRRVALVVSHAGTGPHDSYFFSDPAQMITGLIRPPVLMLDNEVIVKRHLRSLILEHLETSIPSRWNPQIATEDGEYVSDVKEQMAAELAKPGVADGIARAVTRAFTDAALAWLTKEFVADVVEAFPAEVEQALRSWCDEFTSLVAEYLKIRNKKLVPSKDDRRQMDLLERRMIFMREDREYYPLSFLARVGLLPRYGFPGQTIQVVDERQRSISQVAAVGITEYAPGNRVYVAGRKLTVGRIRFGGGAKENPRDHTQTYRYCSQCSYATEDTLAQHCPYCSGDGGERLLLRAECIDYMQGQGIQSEFITDDDEYRDRSEYDRAIYLEPLPDASAATLHEEQVSKVGSLEVRQSRRRTVRIFNRGLRSHGGLPGFMVCLVCGTYRSPAQQRAAAAGAPSFSTGHAASCPVTGWPDMTSYDRSNPTFPEVEPSLHLRTSVNGDVVEIPMPQPVSAAYAAGQQAWVTTMAYALKLGIQREMFVGERELEHFVAVRRPSTGPEVILTFFDTLPGGTGYLRRFFANLPDIAAVAHRHLAECPCESACYRCLKQFWNQRDHELLDKRLVQPALGLLAQGAVTEPRPALSLRERFDSIVESMLFDRLLAAGVARPSVGPNNVLRDRDSRAIIQMDLSWPTRNLVVLIDGREFHSATAEQVALDQRKRNALIGSGQRLLEFTAWEVVHRLDEVVDEVRGVLEGRIIPISMVPSAQLVAADAPPSAVTLAVGEELDGSLVDSLTDGWSGGGKLLANGSELALAAFRESPRTVLAAIDTEAWVSDPSRWRRDLSLLRRAAAAGIPCYRLAGQVDLGIDGLVPD